MVRVLDQFIVESIVQGNVEGLLKGLLRLSPLSDLNVDRDVGAPASLLAGRVEGNLALLVLDHPDQLPLGHHFTSDNILAHRYFSLFHYFHPAA